MPISLKVSTSRFTRSTPLLAGKITGVPMYPNDVPMKSSAFITAVLGVSCSLALANSPFADVTVINRKKYGPSTPAFFMSPPLMSQRIEFSPFVIMTGNLKSVTIVSFVPIRVPLTMHSSASSHLFETSKAKLNPVYNPSELGFSSRTFPVSATICITTFNGIKSCVVKLVMAMFSS